MSALMGQKASPFALHQAPGELVDVGAEFGSAPIVILFFPLSFSSVCSDEFCTIRDDWNAWTNLDAKVYGISVDSPFVTQKFRELENLPFPLLSDFNREVATQFDALHDDLFGLKGVAKRSAFVIDREGTIVYASVSDDPGQMVDFDAIKSAVESC